jgi:VanZ family protein
MVVIGSLYPNAGPPKAGIELDLILHCALYALLAGLVMIIFHNRKTALLLAIAMLPLGFLLEFAQLYIRGRTFSLEDLIANSIGVVIGLLVGLGLRFRLYHT